jgi:AAA+ ATPase superfamily predicted ATPase
MFVGRTQELKKLETMYKSNQFECAVIYGRRRVGKTTLINEFIKDKDAIFFTGLEMGERENLENLSRSIMEFKFPGTEASVFQSFQSALDAVYDLAKEKRVVLAIDEYPYLADSYKSFSSLLQQQIDGKYKNSKLFLILCGSSMSFMENQVLGYKSPLYGRRTAQFKINPFDFFDTMTYYQNFDIYDLAAIYGITGGIPQYLEQIDDSQSVEENIKRNFLDPAAYMFEEPTNLLKQEVREPTNYNAIIKAIAQGGSKLSEIASKTGLGTSAISAYLKNLISLGIVKKETPVSEKPGKKTIYSIQDSMFRFWYRFIPDNAALIQNGLADRAYQKIEGQLPAFTGKVFEDICIQYMWRENAKGSLPVSFTNIGRWWGNNPITRSESEIDILAYDDIENAIFGECKWTNEPVKQNVLETLVERSKPFSYKNKYYYLFAKNGFSSGCKELAQVAGNVKLVCFDDMV